MDPTIDPLDTTLGIPYANLAILRREAPVYRTPSGVWFLALLDDVLEATRRVDAFQSSFRDAGVVVPDEEQLISEIPEPRHGEVRKIVNSAIAAHRLGPVKGFVRDLSEKLLGELLPRGHAELMHDFVMPIPNTVIAFMLGVPTEDFALWAKWSDEVVEGDYATQNRNERGVGLAGAFPEFSQYVDAQIAEHRTAANPPDDFVSRLVQAEVDGKQLSDVELRTLIIFLLVAGNETTRNLIGNLLDTFARSPELFERIAADPSLIPAAIEESLRLDPPVAFLLRDCIADIEIGGVSIAKGEKVAYGIASANRDERYFDDPDTFRLDRTNGKDHTTFGGGPHVCPGSALARLETKVTLEVFAERVASFSIDPGYKPEKVPVFWANGPASLPVTLTGR